jgi:hypothetical protein
MKTKSLMACFCLACHSLSAAESQFIPAAPPGYASDALRQGQEAAMKQRAENLRLAKERAELERQRLDLEQAKANADMAKQEHRQALSRNSGTDLAAIYETPDAQTSKIIMERVRPSKVDRQRFPGIQKLMSHEDFTKSGLTKLNDAEIEALNGWLQKLSQSFAESYAAKLSKEANSVIETQIDGDFEGWTGETIWKMANGQVWQQAEYSYSYSYAFSPNVLIYRGSEGWKMKVEGESDEIAVKRVK